MTSYVRKVDVVKDSANVAGRKKIVFVDASSDTTVPAGSLEAITIQPPAGKIWRCKDIWLHGFPPDGASTGRHSFVIDRYSTYGLYNFEIYADYNSAVEVRGINVAGNLNFNLTISDLEHLFNNVAISHTCMFKCVYYNNTDADQTNTRIIRLLFEKEDEAT